jgi:iron complex outermembrane receptor protein
MKKRLISLAVALTCASAAFAQLSGSLTDEKKQPLASAIVLLLQAKDSIPVRSTISNDKGNFVFDRLTEGQYRVAVSHVGYQKYFSDEIRISFENKSITLPLISLVLSGETLQAVTVTAQKPLVEMQADKLVINVRNSIVAIGNNALEVLQKAPGVAIDQGENISLNGKTGILIYLDGKQTYMSQSDLTTFLKNMRSEQIDKIELITNPSAKYDAAGKAIINIVTVRNRNFGTNGSVSTGVAFAIGPTVPINETNGLKTYKNLGPIPRYNTGLNLNNRKGKVNLFGSVNYNHFRNWGNSESDRTVSGSKYDQYSYSELLSTNFGCKLGLDYFITKKTTIGILYNGNYGHFENPVPTLTNAYIKDLQGVLQTSPRTTANAFYSWRNTSFNANFKHSFDSAGSELSADLDYSFYKNLAKERGLNTRFF